MTQHLRFATLLVLSGLLALPAAVQAKPEAASESFKRMDNNRDNKIVLEEFTIAFPNMREAAFAAIDRNGDKIIDQEEWAVFIKNHGADMKARKMSGHMGGHMGDQNPNNVGGSPNMPQPGNADLPLATPPSGK